MDAQRQAQASSDCGDHTGQTTFSSYINAAKRLRKEDGSSWRTIKFRCNQLPYDLVFAYFKYLIPSFITFDYVASTGNGTATYASPHHVAAALEELSSTTFSRRNAIEAWMV